MYRVLCRLSYVRRRVRNEEAFCIDCKTRKNTVDEHVVFSALAWTPKPYIIFVDKYAYTVCVLCRVSVCVNTYVHARRDDISRYTRKVSLCRRGFRMSNARAQNLCSTSPPISPSAVLGL